MDELRIAVLGPVRAWRADRELGPGTAQQRAVLAALALRGGQVASVQELIEGLWGDEPPASAAVALRNHVSRLRAVLETDPREPRLLVSLAGGYALRLAPDGLDTARADRLAAAAERARATGDPERAVRLLDQALALWQGVPLIGVPGEYAERQRHRLTERRLALLEARLGLELDLGRHTAAAAELTALAEEHPAHEGLRTLQMLALYRCGRQAAALAGYQRTRRHLAEELGIDPGPELAEMHRRILGSDPALAHPGPTAGPPSTPTADAESEPTPPAPPAVAGPPAWVVPAQMPSAVPDFTGRREPAAALAELLDRAPDGAAGTVCVIHGMGGVGKTALAVHTAHRVRARYPDGQLYTDLRGAGANPADPYTVQELFLRALGVPPANIPGDPGERTSLYRSRLAGRRLLILLDNAADTAQVEPLLPGTPDCAVLATSRTPLPCLPVTSRTALDPFTEDEAVALLDRIAGPDRTRQDPDAARRLVRACGLLPLAVRIAASRLAARPRWTIAALVDRLTDRARRLTELEAGSLAVDAAFELSYASLEADQARAFRLLAIPETPDLSPAAAAAVLDHTEDEAEDVLETLADAGLLESTDPGRYRFHDLLRLYGRHRTLEADPDAERAAALSRLALHYLIGVTTALRIERPYSRLSDALDPRTGDPAPPGVRIPATRLPEGPRFREKGDAQRWVVGELPAIVRLCVQILEHPSRPVGATDTRTLAGLLAALLPSTDLRLPWTTLLPAATALVRAAERGDDPAVTVHACIVLAVAHAYTGDHARARTLALRAQATRSVDDGVLPQRTAYTLGTVAALDPDSLDDAAHYFELTRTLAHRNGETGMEAQGALGLAQVRLAAGAPADALRHSEDSLRLWQQADCHLGAALALRGQGQALTALGRHEDAVQRYDDALAICTAHGLHTQRGHTLLAAATAHLAAGHPTRARTLAEEALHLLTTLGDTAGTHRAHNLLTRT
ncbi:AfsR/SARP family transcriptional regulator [Kitasatospora camelliae]|uniref:BTAD domain-containing putative transcriptional regulator n=1 Tax=Kitasatospora camelliae TaxID=3156397 RepID=A0AAU8JSJ7_9ACTN